MEQPAGGSEETRTVLLSIPAKPEYITLGRLALTGLLHAREVAEETVGDLKLALTEACSNSVRHAYRDGREGRVEIRYDLAPDRIAVEVADDGDGFSPAELAVDADLNEGGLGIAIIEALTDEFRIAGGAGGRGSSLRFVKFLTP